MTDDNLPEVEAPLPDNLLDRLEELQRRKEERGLTECEKAIVANDLHEFAEAVKLAIQPMVESMNAVAGNITEAMEPLVEAMSEMETNK